MNKNHGNSAGLYRALVRVSGAPPKALAVKSFQCFSKFSLLIQQLLTNLTLSLDSLPLDASVRPNQRRGLGL